MKSIMKSDNISKFIIGFINILMMCHCKKIQFLIFSYSNLELGYKKYFMFELFYLYQIKGMNMIIIHSDTISWKILKKSYLFSKLKYIWTSFGHNRTVKCGYFSNTFYMALLMTSFPLFIQKSFRTLNFPAVTSRVQCWNKL